LLLSRVTTKAYTVFKDEYGNLFPVLESVHVSQNSWPADS
jgi:hypothetical protein